MGLAGNHRFVLIQSYPQYEDGDAKAYSEFSLEIGMGLMPDFVDSLYNTAPRFEEPPPAKSIIEVCEEDAKAWKFAIPAFVDDDGDEVTISVDLDGCPFLIFDQLSNEIIQTFF